MRPYRDLEPDQFPVLARAGVVETRFDEALHPRDKNGMFTSGGGSDAEIALRLDEIGPDGGWNKKDAATASLAKETESLADYLTPLIKGGKGQLDGLAADPDYDDVRDDIIATRDSVKDASDSLGKVLAASDIHDATAYAIDAADQLMEADAAFLAVVDTHPDDSYVRDVHLYIGTGLDDLQALSDKYVGKRDDQGAGYEDAGSAFSDGPYSGRKNY